jgi:protein CpxP
MNRRLLLALAPASLAVASFAHAQPPNGGPGAGGPGGGHVVRMMHGGPGGAEMKAMHEAMMKQHLEDLKVVLRLRPDQEAALQAFMAAHHPDGPPMMHDMHGGPGDMPKPQTTPERLAEMARHEAAMAAEHEKVRAALARFYAALSPDQQKVFDALQRLQGPHMGGMGGHGMMMGGPGMRRIEIHRMGPGDGGPTPGHEPD